eukprot:m.71976 g.71976  ORF g.71976 m.71976 type:complete len:634 (-) comp12293_c1_seq1:2060-3961(-)
MLQRSIIGNNASLGHKMADNRDSPDHKYLTLAVGNQHRKVDKGLGGSKHFWSAFVRVEKLNPRVHIESTIFYLPRYERSRILVSKPPFKVERWGDQECEITVKVQLTIQPGNQERTVGFKHYLSFRSPETALIYKVDLEDKDNPITPTDEWYSSYLKKPPIIFPDLVQDEGFDTTNNDGKEENTSNIGSRIGESAVPAGGSAEDRFVENISVQSHKDATDASSSSRDTVQAAESQNTDPVSPTTVSQNSVSRSQAKLDLEKIPESDITRGRKLGCGGFGTVFAGTCKGLGDVAIKDLFSSDPNGVDSFRREAMAIASTGDHENVLKFYGICITEKSACMVLELCPGGDLSSVLRIHNQIELTGAVLLDWCAQIAAGMAHIHQHGLYHRDLKPGNILLFYSGAGCPGGVRCKGQRLVIADFGLAKQAEVRLDQTIESVNSMSATQAGTYLYMAPELIERRKFSKGSDVWAFGVIVWQLLTGCQPYCYAKAKEPIAPIALAFKVGYNGERLRVDESWPDPFKTVIRNCQLAEHKQRPQFAEIRDTFTKTDRSDSLNAAFSKMTLSWEQRPTESFVDLVQFVLQVTQQDYSDLLKTLGFASKDDFDLFSEEELERKGFRIVHVRRLKRALAAALSA